MKYRDSVYDVYEMLINIFVLASECHMFSDMSSVLYVCNAHSILA